MPDPGRYLRDLPSETRLRELQILAQRLVDSLLAGNYRSVFRGPGVEFDEVREYVDGDDVRLIDWNVSSRMGQVYTKVFREEREMTLFLVVDSSPSLDYGSGERSLRDITTLAAALLTLAATQNNDKVGGLLFSDEIDSWTAPAKGRAHAMQLIQTIATRTPHGGRTALPKALRTVGESLKRRGVVAIISDFLATGYQRELALISKHHDVIAIRVSDPIATSLPEFPLLAIGDPESGRSALVNGRSRRARFAFEQYWRNHRLQWLRECRRRGISPVEITTVDEVADRLIAYFRAQKRRRR